MLKSLAAGSDPAVIDMMIVVLPHLGILDSWLPILDELKRRDRPIALSAVAPDPKRLARSQPEDFLLERCNALVDSVYARVFGERWRLFDSFDQAANYAREHVKRIPRRPIEALYLQFPHVAAALDRGAPRAKIVLSDIYPLLQPTMKGLRHISRHASWFSLPHGIDPRVPIRSQPRSGASDLDIKIYASSELEARQYEEFCGVPKSRIEIVGVPRHSKHWIRRLRDYYRSRPTEKGRHIFLASRPMNKTFFPSAKKIEALQVLRTLAEQMDCKIIVRPHPAETEIDRAIVESALGREHMEKSWSYSVYPAMVAAEGALFAVSMFSSVAIDMIAIDMPVIELHDFSERTDTSDLVKDAEGRLTSIYQASGLALGATNYEQLKSHADRILHAREAVLAVLKSAYDRNYANPEGSVQLIVRDMLLAIEKQGRGGQLGDVKPDRE